MAWNDTASTLNTTGVLLAGGGGASAYYPKPSWQTGTGVPSDGARDVPDLSMNASPEHDGYLVCVQGSCVNGYRLSATNSTNPNGLTVAGGTSAGSPTFGGIVALINQKMGIFTRQYQPGTLFPGSDRAGGLSRYHHRQ